MLRILGCVAIGWGGGSQCSRQVCGVKLSARAGPHRISRARTFEARVRGTFDGEAAIQVRMAISRR